jgi:hypothetical protein
MLKKYYWLEVLLVSQNIFFYEDPTDTMDDQVANNSLTLTAREHNWTTVVIKLLEDKYGSILVWKDKLSQIKKNNCMLNISDNNASATTVLQNCKRLQLRPHYKILNRLIT